MFAVVAGTPKRPEAAYLHQELTPVVVHQLPRCAIRSDCRWWQQEGASACQRCPQVVTVNYSPSAAMHAAADPDRLPG